MLNYIYILWIILITRNWIIEIQIFHVALINWLIKSVFAHLQNHIAINNA